MAARYIELGGLMMWPLVGCSILLAAVLVERFWTVGVRHRLLGRVVKPSRLAWHQRGLLFFTDVPPSIGLLGTVIGVVRSFQLTDGAITADSAAAGLGVACITTIGGLAIALTATLARYGLDWMAGTPAAASEGRS